MGMPGRKFNAGSGYRYGFNGKELDSEVIQYDYGFRIYDPCLGRFKSVDPLAYSYPWYSPYHFAGNNPIHNIDVDGLEECGYGQRLENQWIPALASGKMTKEQFQRNQNATAVGGAAGIVGGLVIADMVYNQGRGTNFLFKGGIFLQICNGTGWEHSSENTKDPVLKREQQQMAMNSYKGAIVDWGINKAIGVVTKIISESGRIVYKTFSTASIRTTQTTVNGVEKYVQEFSKAGKYTAEPIDIVKMEDGIYSSMDHSRLMAAEKVGVNVKANAHNFDDAIPLVRARQIVGDKVPDELVPKTWGEAIKARVENQGSKYATENPNGSFVRPKVKS